MKEAHRRPVQLLVCLNDPTSTTNLWLLSIQETFYPRLGANGVTAPAPIKTQATSNLVVLGKNKKSSSNYSTIYIQFFLTLNTLTEAKPTPLSQFIGNEGGKKSTPAAWNKGPPAATGPAVLNGPLPKPSPPPNACSSVFLFCLICYEYLSRG